MTPQIRKRRSRARDFIYRLVKSGSLDHPTAIDVYEVVRKDMPHISLGTVYRNLKELSQESELVKIEASDGAVHFDHNTTPHSHFICRACGKVFDAKLRNDIISRITSFKQQGFLIESAELSFTGVCPRCNKV